MGKEGREKGPCLNKTRLNTGPQFEVDVHKD